MKEIGTLTVTVSLVIYGMLMNGWAMTKLWAWFLVPAFGLPAISIPVAIGITVIVKNFQSLGETKKDEKWNEVLAKGFAIATLKPLLALGIGAIVKTWM